MNMVWQPNETPVELHPLLETLAEEYPLRAGGAGPKITFQPVAERERLKVAQTPAGWAVSYGKLSAAARGLGYALAGIAAEERLTFETFGILVDCSRTAVFTVDGAKRWLRRLALMGYTQFMLYTKDAYQLDGEPYFGYMRGAYSLDEIREIDAYAAKLGIEMVASIQALGHLEPQLRWPAYANVRDTDSVILVDEPASYALLEKMIAFWSGALNARRIHLGMDETHDLGRGRFLDKHGYERPFDIYNRHLARLCEICAKFQLKPMIWSDMYFRFGSATLNYYDPETVIPDDVKAAIPKEAALYYWDYYHRDKAFYANRLARHRDLGKEPLMASGIWTWLRLWYDHEQTTATVKPCIDACRETGVKEFLFTLWGDDGSYCEFDSAFAGMAWAADYAFNPAGADAVRIEALFGAIFGTRYALQLKAGELEISYFKPDGTPDFDVAAAMVLWDDPLMGIVWHELLAKKKDVWTDVVRSLRRTRDALAPHRADAKAGQIDYAWNIAHTLVAKLEFRAELLRAYAANDRAALAGLKDRNVPEVISALEALDEVFRRQWFRSYKPYGLEVMQIKLAGLAARYREVARRLDEYLGGRIGAIPELELHPKTIGAPDGRYRMIATGGWFI